MANKKFSVQDLVEEVAAKSSLTKKFTDEFLRELVSVIEEYLEKDGVVKVKGLGTFKLVWNGERKSVNVTTGEEIVLPAHYKVTFTAEPSVLNHINGEEEPQAAGPLEESPSASASPSVPGTESALPRRELPKPFFIPIPGKDTPAAEPEPVPEPVQEPSTVPAQESSSAPAAEPAQEEPDSREAAPEPPADDDFGMRPVRKKHGWAWLVILVVLAALAAAAWYSRDLWYDGVRGWYESVTGNGVPVYADTVFSDSAVEDESSAFTEGDSVSLEEEPMAEADSGTIIAEETDEERRQRLLDGYTPSVAQDAPVRETVIVAGGSRLTLFALRAYGHKDFWVYVYDANRDVLTSPNALAKGMSLKIPDLDPLLTDPDNEACLAKAAELAARY